MRLIQYTISFSERKPSLLHHVTKGAGIGVGVVHGVTAVNLMKS